MGWDRGRYFTRSKKVKGRVVREYVGTGRIGELAAQMDTIKREQQEAERAAFQALSSELDAMYSSVKELNKLADLLARAALVAAGFQQHKRGEWRKRRDQRCPAE
jgi:hypothetical protein